MRHVLVYFTDLMAEAEYLALFRERDLLLARELLRRKGERRVYCRPWLSVRAGPDLQELGEELFGRWADGMAVVPKEEAERIAALVVGSPEENPPAPFTWTLGQERGGLVLEAWGERDYISFPLGEFPLPAHTAEARV